MDSYETHLYVFYLSILKNDAKQEEKYIEKAHISDEREKYVFTLHNKLQLIYNKQTLQLSWHY